LVEAALKTVSK